MAQHTSVFVPGGAVVVVETAAAGSVAVVGAVAVAGTSAAAESASSAAEV